MTNHRRVRENKGCWQSMKEGWRRGLENPTRAAAIGRAVEGLEEEGGGVVYVLNDVDKVVVQIEVTTEFPEAKW